MKTKLRLFLLALSIGLTIQAQTYDFSLVRNSDYNFSVVAIPDYAQASPNPTIAQIGFLLAIPDGVAIGPVTGLGFTLTTAGPYDISPADTETGRDAFHVSFLFAPRVDLGPNVIGQPITVATFDVLGSPTTGSITLFDNAHPVPLSVAPSFDSFIQVDPTGIVTNPTSDIYNAQAGTVTHSFTVLGVSEVNLEGVSVYPNPASDYVKISGVSDLQTVEVISITGKRVQLIENATTTVNMSNLQSGVYFMKITTANGVATKKVVKQ